MRGSVRWAVVVVSVLTTGVPASPAAADHGTRPDNRMQALGHSPHAASFADPAASRHVNSDLAFWGNLAFNGNYNGWRTIDISNPNNPRELDWYNECNGDQGDLVVWQDILVRSWNSPAPSGRTCGGSPVPTGFEGLHVFDISDVRNPVLKAAVDLECGSHTTTLAGIQAGELIIWSNISSSTGCADGTRPNDDPAGDFMDIVAVPINDPAGARLVRREPLEGPTSDIRTGCHDAGVILLDVNKAACASADTINVWDIGQNNKPGGSLTDPTLLFTVREPGVGDASSDSECPACTGRWHSAAWSWDGEVLIAGWEPGGGSQAECEGEDRAVEKSLFFYDGDTGAKLGQWVLPRGQGSDENCTVHNYNVVPMENDRYILVGGHYQAGTWAVDFTRPANPQTLGWSDPPTLGPGPFCDADDLGTAGNGPAPAECQLGGAWSTYWYNDSLFESDITKGLNVFRSTHPRLDAELTTNLPFLNPQTQMLGPVCKGVAATHAGTDSADVLVGTEGADVIVAGSGRDRVIALKGDDVVCAGKGKDKVSGAGGQDVLRGQRGNDNLRGGGASDRLAGGKGRRDRCHGGPGNDRIARSCEKVLQP